MPIPSKELKHNHLKRPPRSKIPELVDVSYEKTAEDWRQLESIILDTYENYKISLERIENAQVWVKDIESALKKHIPDARIDIFGSLLTGLGTIESDVDMCFRFGSDEPPKDLIPIDVIKNLRDILIEEFTDAELGIVSGTVPIVEVKMRDFEGDIIYYDAVKLKTSELLEKYCEWEPKRFPQLAIFIKKWAKDTTIKNPVHQTLSSYSLALLVVHFLQKKAVLPPWDIEEGREFLEVAVQPNWSSNVESLGQLFVDFLDYFSRFDYNNRISITTLELVDRRVMDPTNRKHFCIPMEDPIVPGYDPGKRLCKYVFRWSREVFAGQITETSWNKSLRLKCCRFEEERKISERNCEEMEEGSFRILKALAEFAEKGGTMKELVSVYNRIHQSTLRDDFHFYFGTNDKEEIFSQPMLANKVVFEKDMNFTLTEKFNTDFLEYSLPRIKNGLIEK